MPAAVIDQMILELINRRGSIPPPGRDGPGLNKGLNKGAISTVCEQLLTMNETSATVSRARDQDMTAQDYFAHADSGGRDPIERLIAAGYLFHRRREHCVQRNHGDACRRGNFNGDGESDIFLQNSSGGRLLVWEMNGATVLSADSGSIGVNLGENGRAD